MVIQVGDLIDRGPDSAGVLAFVWQRLADSRRWIQLIGNHESQYLGAEGCGHSSCPTKTPRS
ncbi:metallophosphoesterase [Micromonospora sp. WMMD964]|uniref:metallophosphoesterase n=1 Tax=Micromonospora sp. WMMD964 TaxID=3016091 RepID=UPI002499F233|nr:metallophosphoesterase [Micromonospora sp. WMMD964]WFE98601.1 metallophosphoesterase [Micromonospora sp. WMMD964]